MTSFQRKIINKCFWISALDEQWKRAGLYSSTKGDVKVIEQKLIKTIEELIELVKHESSGDEGKTG